MYEKGDVLRCVADGDRFIVDAVMLDSYGLVAPGSAYEWWPRRRVESADWFELAQTADQATDSEDTTDHVVPDTETRAISHTGGQKGRKPEEYALIPSMPLREVAVVYGWGATKYSPHNWRQGYPYSWSLSALYRHIEAFRQGETLDNESGLHHLAHATFHLFTLMEYEFRGLGDDDRQDTGVYDD